MNEVSDLGLDLENLFQPAWAKGAAETNRFDKFTGHEGVKPERRGKRDGDRRGPRREGGFGGGEKRGDRPRSGGKFGGGKKGFGRRDDRGPRPARRDPEPPAPLPEITVTFLPDEKGVEQLARQIRMTGRAYPLFQIAQLVLEKPERYSVRLTVKKNAEGATAQPLFVCALDDSPWLSEDEVVAHVLKNHFATFYQAERTPTEPPKGTYTFVAQCGMSGVILGPPNYHDYQNQLRKLHAERFSRMPFDAFKARVKIVKDEAVVKKWIEDQSFKTEFTCLNVPEPLKLPSMEEVEKHFRATHKDAIIKLVETLVVDGVKSRNLRNRDLYRLVRTEWENQKHFPLQLATLLSKMFATHGLQFFKVNKTVVHVSVARPLYLDLETTPVSDGIKRIVNFINSTPKCTRKKLVEAIAPSPKPEAKPAAETPAPAAEVQGDSTPTPAEPAALPVAEPTPEQTAVLVDLHWLIHAGAVLEFADGRMETAKKPLPRPARPEKKPAEEQSAVESETAAPSTEVASQPETAAEPTTEVQAPAEAPSEPVEEPDKPVSETPAETAAPGAEPAPSETSSADAAPTEEVPSPS